VRAPSRAFPTFLHAAVHVLVGRFSRTPHLGWVAAMYPLCGHALLGFVASSSESGAAAFAHGTFSCCPHKLSARDIPCSSNQRDTCQSPSMLCFVSAHTMRMCGHSTVLPCFHGCALPVHVVQAPRTSVQFGAQCCSTVCLITCPCSPLLASTNHSFGSPGIRLRVDDHSVEMRSRGCCF